ncbi:hypothetical protein QE152_g15581 [Popillia japonica]|uniref:V(D)J recombination-activating protein 1 RNase H domain-containing protein n=1 Tax=Popillia japonica TaxID=7064 RepID=A0AAW1L7N4_POPJA
MNIELKSTILLLLQQFLLRIEFLNSEREVYYRRRMRNALTFLGLHQKSSQRSVVNGLHDCCPSLHKLTQSEASIVPDNIFTTESIVEVDLQALLNTTVQSVFRSIQDVTEIDNSLSLLCKWGFDGSSGHSMYNKWGFDGSSGHSMYKQKFDDTKSSDAFLFVTAFVPLKLIHSVSKTVIWSNPRPCSTLFCRPIRLEFIKETATIIKNEEEKMKTCISNLDICNITHQGIEYKVTFNMFMTMLDGSAINTVSGTNATSTCFVCGAKPSEMNSVSIVEKPPHPDTYKYGLSSLHCWIRSFECLLHISYRLYHLNHGKHEVQKNRSYFKNVKNKSKVNFDQKWAFYPK